MKTPLLWCEGIGYRSRQSPKWHLNSRDNRVHDEVGSTFVLPNEHEPKVRQTVSEHKKNPRARASEVSCIKNKPPSNDTTIIAIIIATAPLSFCQAAIVNSPDRLAEWEVGWEHYDSLGELTLVCTHARHAATYLNHHLVLPLLFTKLPQDQQATHFVRPFPKRKRQSSSSSS